MQNPVQGMTEDWFVTCSAQVPSPPLHWHRHRHLVSHPLGGSALPVISQPLLSWKTTTALTDLTQFWKLALLIRNPHISKKLQAILKF